MSETTFATSVIKLATSVISLKASVIYVSIALGMLISWHLKSTIIPQTNIPEENHIIILNLIGIGFGSLYGHTVNFAISSVKKTIDDYNFKKHEVIEMQKELDLEEEEKNKREKNILKKIEISFPHLLSDQKEELILLTKQDKNLDLRYPNLAALVKLDYIKILSHISGETYLCAINPIIKLYISEMNKKIVHENVEAFLTDKTKDKDTLLKLLTGNQKGPKVSSSVFDICDNLIITKQIDSDGIWIYFNNDDYKSALEEKTGEVYEDEVFIYNEKIKKIE